jgi:hypothetical protein
VHGPFDFRNVISFPLLFSSLFILLSPSAPPSNWFRLYDPSLIPRCHSSPPPLTLLTCSPPLRLQGPPFIIHFPPPSLRHKHNPSRTPNTHSRASLPHHHPRPPLSNPGFKTKKALKTNTSVGELSTRKDTRRERE